MALRHPMVGRILPVAGISQNVVRANRTTAAKGWFKDRRVARHREAGERFSRRPRKRVERIGVYTFPDYIVKERAKLCPAELYAGIGHGLNKALWLKLSGDRNSGSVQDLESASLIAHLGDARL